MKKLFSIACIVFVFTLVGCNDSAQEEMNAQEIKELVHEYSIGDFEDVSASITSDELIVMDSDEKETSYSLPKDEFFVSIAPFVKTTHPCAVHSLTGCQGELVNKEFNVSIEDKDGKVIVDETLTTLDNGFIDIWLPRDNTFHVKIEHEGKVSESEISTFEGDNTCITTMQLI
ncbi:CueP family metal-binding protein [Oceanobacillus sp. Castelsardo]|uniref:CueP family metal-binding protein n=1 Tax=Oceanobacillus sp. Castelsardo TaxID=1851204 RepID=UPI0008386DF9|nr:CueP family metal-binding protein [Oceanobacillus sp. Castelsardo]